MKLPIALFGVDTEGDNIVCDTYSKYRECWEKRKKIRELNWATKH